MLLIANWKMNPSTLQQARGMTSKLKNYSPRRIQVWLAVPSLFLGMLARESRFRVGAQNIYYERRGAYTGEISAPMVKSVGGTFAIVGHSERRRQGETIADVQKKVATGLRSGLDVVLCIGEPTMPHTKQRLSPPVVRLLRSELKEATSLVSPSYTRRLILVYEPWWAISTAGKGAADSVYIEKAALFVWNLAADRFGKPVRLLYGGSVNSATIGDICRIPHIDGALVGKASLNPEEFGRMIKITDAINAKH